MKPGVYVRSQCEQGRTPLSAAEWCWQWLIKGSYALLTAILQIHYISQCVWWVKWSLAWRVVHWLDVSGTDCRSKRPGARYWRLNYSLWLFHWCARVCVYVCVSVCVRGILWWGCTVSLLMSRLTPRMAAPAISLWMCVVKWFVGRLDKCYKCKSIYYLLLFVRWNNLNFCGMWIGVMM